MKSGFAPDTKLVVKATRHKIPSGMPLPPHARSRRGLLRQFQWYSEAAADGQTVERVDGRTTSTRSFVGRERNIGADVHVVPRDVSAQNAVYSAWDVNPNRNPHRKPHRMHRNSPSAAFAPRTKNPPIFDRGFVRVGRVCVQNVCGLRLAKREDAE